MMVFSIVSASATVAGSCGDPRSVGDDLECIGGTTWTQDIRITRNSADDGLPQVVVDSAHNSHIIWQRSGYWTLTFDRRGTFLTKEVFITPHVVRGYGSPDRYPLGPQVAIDGASNIHVVWDDGFNNCYYQKYDPDGNSVTGEVQIGNVDNTASHVPSVAVDPVDGNVHIVHEDYEYQCEDIVYDKLDNNGKVLVSEVAVSSDISSHCEHSTLATDGQGYVHVAFGSSNGAWWRKVDTNGVPRGGSVNLFTSPSYKIADLACTPNGDVHLAWTDNGTVHYTRLDNNGTVLDEDVAVSEDCTSPGPPRIAADHEDNTVHIVWHDLRDGNAEIYYAAMEEGSYDTTPENIRLTRDTSQSLYPWVAVSPTDTVHVVWQDDRDGNSEVYYKFMFNFKMELGVVNVAELAGMYFFHPDETKKVDMYIRNLGLIQDDYTVTLDIDDWAETRGWSYQLNETAFYRVPGNSSVFFNLSMTAPANAMPGDYVNVSVIATSASGEDDQLAWRSFVIVEKRVTLTCKEARKVVASGGEVSFDLKVVNIGDVPDQYRIEYNVIPAEGWKVDIDLETVELGVDEAADLTVTVTAPEAADANANGTVFVRVKSYSDASVWDGKKLTAIVDPDFLLEIEAPVPALWVDPAGSVEFPLVVRNEGNLPSKVAITVTSSAPRPGWGAVTSHETLLLAGGEEQYMSLTLTAPADALAGTRQVVSVNTLAEDYASQASVQLTATVRQVHGLCPSIDCTEVSVHGGEVGEHLVTVNNEGNGNELVTLGFALLPPGWDVEFELDGAPVQEIWLMSKAVKTLVVRVTTPPDAEAGPVPALNVVLTDATGTSYMVPYQLRILGRYAVDLSAPFLRSEDAPGGVLAYQLTVANEGNAEDEFVLEHGPLPGPGWTASFHGTGGTPLGSVVLAGGERRDVELRVSIPVDADLAGPVDLQVRATSSSGEVDEVKLVLEVLMPDLRIASVEYDPPKPTATEPTQVTVRVANAGSSAAGDVTVVMMDGDEVVGTKTVGTIEEGSTATVTFRWEPSPGKHSLTYSVSSDVRDVDYEDNELDHLKTVGGDDPDQSGFGVLAVLTALACLVVAARVRRGGPRQ